MDDLPQYSRSHKSIEASPSAGSLSPLEVTFCIDQVSNGQATLVSEEAGSINWPTDKLPKGHQVGDKITLKIPQKLDNRCCKDCDDMEHMRQLLEELVN